LPWKFVEKLFFNKGLISGLILLRKDWKDLGYWFWKRRTFLLLAAGSALEKVAALVNPENKPTRVTRVNWTLSWPIALEICGKTVHLGLPMHLVVPILILA
jgi:hypothetical protein